MKCCFTNFHHANKDTLNALTFSIILDMKYNVKY